MLVIVRTRQQVNFPVRRPGAVRPNLHTSSLPRLPNATINTRFGSQRMARFDRRNPNVNLRQTDFSCPLTATVMRMKLGIVTSEITLRQTSQLRLVARVPHRMASLLRRRRVTINVRHDNGFLLNK